MSKEDKKRLLIWAVVAILFFALIDLFVIKTVSAPAPEKTPDTAASETVQQAEDGARQQGE